MVKEKETSKHFEPEYDQDASQETWNECYKKIYKASNWAFWGMFNYENLKRTYTKVRRFYALLAINEKYPEFNEYPAFKMSGDTDFNFGSNKKRNQKYEKFKKLLEDDLLINDSKCYLSKLEECNNRNYKLENFSFMPMTGSLQLIKQNCDNDRLDVFIYTLNKYYETGILDHARKRNKDALETYLKLFDDIYDYCSKIYMINSKDFVDKIILQGNEPINCAARVVEYIELAEEFWNIKKEALNNANSIDVKN